MYKYNYLTLPLLVHEYEELCSLALILWSLSVILLMNLKCLIHLICLSLQYKYLLFLVSELIQSYSCLFPVWKNKEQFKLFNTINVIIKTMCMQCIGTFFFWKWLDKIFTTPIFVKCFYFDKRLLTAVLASVVTVYLQLSWTNKKILSPSASLLTSTRVTWNKVHCRTKISLL